MIVSVGGRVKPRTSKKPLKSTFLRVYVSLHCPKGVWLLKLPFTGTALSCND